MNQVTWTCIVLLGLVSLSFSSPIVKRQALDDHALNPAEQPISNVKLSYKYGTGAALPVRRVSANEPTTTEDAVEFTPGERVSLELPDPLFGSGFSLVTNVSKAAGSLIQNSAERTARLFEAMKPFFKTIFGVDSLKITRDVPGIDNSI